MYRPTTPRSSAGRSGCFDEAGLELPSVTITHHGEDRAACRGRAGQYQQRDGRVSIDICTLQGGLLVERLVLHELAHAWADHDLDRDHREQFRDRRGWIAWASDEAGWHDLGREQAAEIIAWGLSDRPIPNVLVGRSSCVDLELGYRALTGTPPLHGLRDRC